MITKTTTRPILFSGEMVRAILANRKSQTRRIIKPQPNCPATMDSLTYRDRSCCIWPAEKPAEHGRHPDYFAACPYGKPGDRLWVREAWSPDHAAFYPNYPNVYRADSTGIDIEEGKVFSPEQNASYPFRWRPSIHMPRWASRITLEITDIRVERLNDISEADAKAEGVCGALAAWDRVAGDKSTRGQWTAREEFRAVWELINGPHSWAENPWVWVVEFEKLEKTNAE